MGSITATGWIAIAIVLLIVLWPAIFPDTTIMICPSCGGRGVADTKRGGNVLIEIILWLCFIVPGLIYSIWRANAKQKICKHCGQPGVIPINTPRGIELTAKYPVAPCEAKTK